MCVDNCTKNRDEVLKMGWNVIKIGWNVVKIGASVIKIAQMRGVFYAAEFRYEIRVS